jgi:3-hydroxyacyl-[acyl-carrier-protein] dehydratase
LLVDRVVEVRGETVRCERRITADDPLCADGLPELLVVEALAQTAACLMGSGFGEHRGYFVSANSFQFDGRAQPGDTIALSATKTAALGALHRFDGEARVDGRVIARGQMTFAVQG